MTPDGDPTPDRDTVAVLRQAIDGEAQAAPPADDVWARMRRRLGRRRAARVGGITAVGAMLVVAAGVAGTAVWQPPWQSDESAASEVVFGEPDVPPSWQTVTVGGADVSVPPSWDVVDARGQPGDEEPCPGGPGLTLWVRERVGASASAWLPEHCDAGPVGRAMQISDAGRSWSYRVDAATGAVAELEGTTTRLGSVAAWRAVLDASHDTDFDDAPNVRTWLAPAIDVAVQVPAGLGAADVLATVRPHSEADTDAVLLTLDTGGPWQAGEPAAAYIAVTARGRRHVWFTRPRDPVLSDPDERGGYRFRGMRWPGMAADRYAVIEGTESEGISLITGSSRGGQVLWREPAAGRDLTSGSFAQVAWSPDGTALAWYVPRREPVMGVVQWADTEAMADGEAPVQEQTVTVAGGPVHAEPTGRLRWQRDDGGWVLELIDGQPPPWEPDMPLEERQWHDWRLPLGPDDDGIITLPDPVTWQRLEQADHREQGRGS